MMVEKFCEDCPSCHFQDTTIRVALHLSETHHWPFPRVIDWLRSKEEVDV